MSDTQLIKDKLDIVDFISEYVQVKPAGINHKACCPFHQEKTPSFMVSRERQSFKCFGCGKGGDIFTFLQEIEGMDFVEALKFLADRAGVQLTHRVSEVNSSQKNRIKDINVEAARFFHNFLLKMAVAKPAMDYLLNRGLKLETIEEWQIGFVPEQWDLLTQYLLKKGFGIDDLVAAGLTIQREGADKASGRGFYDRFRGRIMFPIQDVHGGVVGFTGRILVEKDNTGGKYVNTPQTLVYDKSRVVFGLNKAKQEIKAKDLVAVVEGQTDVISCHQAGMKNVVASSGTAFTEFQVKLLKRYSSNMNMAFDADEAGQKAAKRGIDVAIAEGMNVKVIRIPDGAGKDPDECIKKNPQVWFDCVKNAQGVMEWYFTKAFANKNLSDPKQKQIIADELLPEIGLIPYAVEQDHWLRELGGRINVDVAVLREDMKRLRKKPEARSQKPEARDVNSLKNVQKTRLDMLIERYLVLLLKYSSIISDNLWLKIDSCLSTSQYLPLYDSLQKQYNDNKVIDVEKLRNEVDSGNQENLVDSLQMQGEWEFSSITESEAEVEIRNLIDQIKKEWLKHKRESLQMEIERVEKEGDKNKLNQLLEEFNKL